MSRLGLFWKQSLRQGLGCRYLLEKESEEVGLSWSGESDTGKEEEPGQGCVNKVLMWAAGLFPQILRETYGMLAAWSIRGQESRHLSVGSHSPLAKGCPEDINSPELPAHWPTRADPFPLAWRKLWGGETGHLV